MFAHPISIIFVLAGLVAGLTSCRDSGQEISERQYRTYLSISQLKAAYYTEPKTQTKYPLVQGSLSNLGSKQLIVVEFNLRFKDNMQNVIYEEHAYPVFVSDFASPSANQSLAPGQKTRFAFKTPKCPANWEPGNVDIEVTKIVFARQS